MKNMSDSVSYFFNEEPTENKKELSQDVINILDLFRLLSSEEKATVKRLIREENIF